jgi:hypothetical protein
LPSFCSTLSGIRFFTRRVPFSSSSRRTLAFFRTLGSLSVPSFAAWRSRSLSVPPMIGACRRNARAGWHTSDWVCFPEHLGSRNAPNCCAVQHLAHIRLSSNWVCFARLVPLPVRSTAFRRVRSMGILPASSMGILPMIETYGKNARVRWRAPHWVCFPQPLASRIAPNCRTAKDLAHIRLRSNWVCFAHFVRTPGRKRPGLEGPVIFVLPAGSEAS